MDLKPDLSTGYPYPIPDGTILHQIVFQSTELYNKTTGKHFDTVKHLINKTELILPEITLNILDQCNQDGKDVLAYADKTEHVYPEIVEMLKNKKEKLQAEAKQQSTDNKEESRFHQLDPYQPKKPSQRKRKRALSFVGDLSSDESASRSVKKQKKASNDSASKKQASTHQPSPIKHNSSRLRKRKQVLPPTDLNLDENLSSPSKKQKQDPSFEQLKISYPLAQLSRQNPVKCSSNQHTTQTPSLQQKKRDHLNGVDKQDIPLTSSNSDESENTHVFTRFQTHSTLSDFEAPPIGYGDSIFAGFLDTGIVISTQASTPDVHSTDSTQSNDQSEDDPDDLENLEMDPDEELNATTFVDDLIAYVTRSENDISREDTRESFVSASESSKTNTLVNLEFFDIESPDPSLGTDYP